MINNTDSLTRVLDKYKFTAPLDSAQRSRALSSRKTTLKKILKLRGEYSLIFALAVLLDFILRKGGIRLGMLQVKIVLAAGIAASTGSTVAAVYYAEKHFSKPVHKQTTEIIEQQKEEVRTIPVAVKTSSPVYMIGVQPITTDRQSGIESAYVTGKIIHHLAMSEGESSVAGMQSGSKNRCRMMLTGSLTKFDQSLVLSIKIIDMKTSEVVYLATEKLNSAAELDTACTAVARIIHQNVKNK